jgi:hypothetical protein
MYKRINASAKYSKTFFREKSPLLIDLKLDLLSTLDGEKWDPDMILEEENYAQDEQIRTNFSANWSLNKAYISHLTFDFGYEKTWQEVLKKHGKVRQAAPIILLLPPATANTKFRTAPLLIIPK